MSLVTPIPQQSEIKLYKGIGWDSHQHDIRLFDSISQRQSYLSSRTVATWNNCSIVRTGNSIKLEGRVDDYLECSYMSWINTGMGTTPRTFYAFIESVEYVNVNTFLVSYTIDWIQTYLFELEIDECFVEREHVNDDTIGLNLLDEGLELGEYMIQDEVEKVFTPAIIAYTLPDESTATQINNVGTCLQVQSFSLSTSDLEVLLHLIENFNTTPERIVMLQMGAAGMVGTSSGISQNISLLRERNITDGIRTYTPRNNKLLTYPYCLMTVDNYQGEVEQFQWELFANDLLARFNVVGYANPKPCMSCSPVNYRGTEGNADQETVIYDNFPQVPFATDAFRAWISQYGTSKAVTVGASVVSSIASIAMGNVVGGAAGLATTGANAYQEYQSHKIHSQQFHGSIGSAGLSFAKNQVGFRLTSYAIRPENAERIDNYFTRYGYKVDKSKVPNIKGRSILNYVKCETAKVNGDAPVDATEAMESALMRGVTFWHVDTMGSAVTNNPIVSSQ